MSFSNFGKLMVKYGWTSFHYIMNIFSRKSCLWSVCSGIIFFGVMPMVFGSNGTFNPNKYGVVGFFFFLFLFLNLAWLVRFQIQVPWSIWVTYQLKNNYNFLYRDNLLNEIFLFFFHYFVDPSPWFKLDSSKNKGLDMVKIWFCIKDLCYFLFLIKFIW